MLGSVDSAAWDLGPATSVGTTSYKAVAAIALKVFLTRDTAPGGGFQKVTARGNVLSTPTPSIPELLSQYVHNNSFSTLKLLVATRLFKILFFPRLGRSNQPVTQLGLHLIY